MKMFTFVCCSPNGMTTMICARDLRWAVFTSNMRKKNIFGSGTTHFVGFPKFSKGFRSLKFTDENYTRDYEGLIYGPKALWPLKIHDCL